MSPVISFSETSQIIEELGGNLVTLVSVLLEAFEDDRIQPGKRIRIERKYWFWIRVQYTIDGFDRRGPLERWPSGRHFIEHGSQTKNVGPRINIMAMRLLGAHVLNRSDYGSRFGQGAG